MLRLISRSVGDEEFTNNFRTDTATKGLQLSIVTEFWCFDAYFYKYKKAARAWEGFIDII